MEMNVEKYWVDCVTGKTELMNYAGAILADKKQFKYCNSVEMKEEIVQEAIVKSHASLFINNKCDYKNKDNSFIPYIKASIFSVIIKMITLIINHENIDKERYKEITYNEDLISKKIKQKKFFDNCLKALEKRGVHPTFIQFFKFYFLTRTSYQKMSELSGFSKQRISYQIRQCKKILKEEGYESLF